MPLEYALKYNCGPVARHFHADRHSRVKLLIGPFGTGKTTSAGYDLIELASQCVRPTQGKKRSRFAVVRNTFPQLRDTTIKTYLDWFPPLYFGTYNATNKIYRIEYDGREIEIIFKALDSPQDVRDLLSLELTGAHVDEAREIHHDVLKGLLGRIGRFPSMKDAAGENPFLTPPQILLTTNYPSTEHWLYKDFVETPIDGYALYKQDQEENIHNLRPGYYQDLERDYANRPDLLKTLVRGEWGVTVRGKMVYPEFRRHLHVASAPLRPTTPTMIYRGWDNTGLSPAIAFSYVTTAGQWRVFKEFCFEDVGIMDATEAVVLWGNQHLPKGCRFVDYADPAGSNRDSTKQSPADYIRRKALELGVDIQLINSIQTWKVRRESVALRLNKLINGEPALLIDPSCTRLIDGFDGGFAYAEIGNSGVFKTIPEKNIYSHISEAVQYIAAKLFTGVHEKEVASLSQLYYDEDEPDYQDDPVGRSLVGGY